MWMYCCWHITLSLSNILPFFDEFRASHAVNSIPFFDELFASHVVDIFPFLMNYVPLKLLTYSLSDEICASHVANIFPFF